MLVAASLVAGTLVWRTYTLELEGRSNQKLAIKNQLLLDRAKIAEEFYLGLDNSRAREQQLNSLLSNRKASVILRFEPERVQITVPDSDVFQWQDKLSSNNVDYGHMIVQFGDLKLGQLYIEVHWESGWRYGNTRSLFFILIGIISLVAFSWSITSIVFKKRVFDPFMESFAKMRQWEAAAETTQMIAHDVRKPFHLLQLAIQGIQKAKDPQQIQKIVGTSLVKAQQLGEEVERMLQDLLDLERPIELKRQMIPVLPFISERIRDLDQAIRGKRAQVDINIREDLVFDVDPFRMKRVFDNILKNAVEAVDEDGRIWINAIVCLEKSELKISIGNSGSYISSSDINNLFSHFYTRGKFGGTGLGLAIAQKFVLAHGGKIECFSSRSEGTVFNLSMRKQFFKKFI